MPDTNNTPLTPEVYEAIGAKRLHENGGFAWEISTPAKHRVFKIVITANHRARLEDEAGDNVLYLPYKITTLQQLQDLYKGLVGETFPTNQQQ
jgi:hypothetical protein